jgi:hypothetical protein
LALQEQTLAAQIDVLGADHPDVGVASINLGNTLELLGRCREALPTLPACLRGLQEARRGSVASATRSARCRAASGRSANWMQPSPRRAAPSRSPSAARAANPDHLVLSLGARRRSPHRARPPRRGGGRLPAAPSTAPTAFPRRSCATVRCSRCAGWRAWSANATPRGARLPRARPRLGPHARHTRTSWRRPSARWARPSPRSASTRGRAPHSRRRSP